MSMPSIERAENGDRRASTIRVRLADPDGWDLRVERDGQVITTEHFTDWHRVERRRASLEADMSRAAPRTWPAIFLILALVAGRVSAQEATSGLLPEPRALEKAVSLVTELKEGDAETVRDGFYPELGHMITGAGYAGGVAPRAADLDLGRTSYGAGVRLHTGASTIARFDAATSGEGWRFLFRVNDPIRLARLGRRTAAIPFVP